MESEELFTKEYIYAIFFKVILIHRITIVKQITFYYKLYTVQLWALQALEGIAESAPQMVLNIYILLIVWNPGAVHKYSTHLEGI
jgi:hypothetical protein